MSNKQISRFGQFLQIKKNVKLIDGKIFCVHGGHSPKISHIDQIRTITRFREIPVDDEFSDLLWSDPTDLVDYWGVNQRGTGYMFGEKVNKEFNHINNIELTCRSHQLTMDGFKYMFSDFGLLTVWSAPNYCYRCGNAASVVKFDEHLNRVFNIFVIFFNILNIFVIFF
ncbi:Serine/threonine-protein phosphatase 6 catalytic subunit [Bonamia ostreae]|uniref:protein-serine/threonine phosphatase n=1 Tax=Bonamia ostreae TaxID=126728 RepID=A0ABV2ASE2_9EUKA